MLCGSREWDVRSVSARVNVQWMWMGREAGGSCLKHTWQNHLGSDGLDGVTVLRFRRNRLRMRHTATSRIWHECALTLVRAGQIVSIVAHVVYWPICVPNVTLLHDGCSGVLKTAQIWYRCVAWVSLKLRWGNRCCRSRRCVIPYSKWFLQLYTYVRVSMQKILTLVFHLALL